MYLDTQSFTSLRKRLKAVLKGVLVLGLVLTLVLSFTQDALAARRGGGRIGGGSFRAPSRTYTAPSRPMPGGGSGYYPRGGFGFPFLLPFFGFGGFGSLFSILIVLALANFVIASVRRIGSGDSSQLPGMGSNKIAVAKVQVGLLSNARSLQSELDQLAYKADTGSTAGLATALQETTLSLLRHPEYWVYASSELQNASLESAEATFNRFSLMERSKFSSETLSNVNQQLKQAEAQLPSSTAILEQEPSEYIVVTLLVGATGTVSLPKTITSPEALQQTLEQLGAVGSDRLLAFEVLWTPQADGDVLSAADLLVEYPGLKRI